MSQQRVIPPGYPGKFFEPAISDPDDRIRIAQRALSGESLESLASEYGISTRTVARYRDALRGEGEN
ncbi:helix-turn-helix domain-containing protein [Mycobacteroides abscessus]|nr:helix-turn-helix domain-containing protein [Mycobacteroides abscessus]MBN7463753.1 helix-turn-helix domain-containing protein [Mycobacteroides abscessus subsp. abscessus]MBN7555240.1 helix-turn-helix domain-containing protein [Mycobacteroides abscessus subsp. abscessus]MDM2404632.1 helix-turn-helix domain-containing protein [Mycobacteroides abscessus]MDM2414350.1 helix-turn-helix domain-containing protein [Mycobacteroides abscessus]MDO3011905.1 helix-turn-helix domain-containing protein [My